MEETDPLRAFLEPVRIATQRNSCCLPASPGSSGVSGTDPFLMRSWRSILVEIFGDAAIAWRPIT